MILGLDGFTWLHIAISLVALATGFIVLGGFLSGQLVNDANNLFIVTTIATSVSGLMFPFKKILPSHVVAGLSLVALAIAVYAYSVARLAGHWRRTYVIAAIAALYLNVFVLVAQTFLKNPSLLELAPTQSEMPFAVTQGLVLFAFIYVGCLAWSRTGSHSVK